MIDKIVKTIPPLFFYDILSEAKNFAGIFGDSSPAAQDDMHFLLNKPFNSPHASPFTPHFVSALSPQNKTALF